jgi:hypothetical protein
MLGVCLATKSFLVQNRCPHHLGLLNIREVFIEIQSSPLLLQTLSSEKGRDFARVTLLVGSLRDLCQDTAV